MTEYHLLHKTELAIDEILIAAHLRQTANDGCGLIIKCWTRMVVSERIFIVMKAGVYK